MYKGQTQREPLPRTALRVCWNVTRNDTYPGRYIRFASMRPLSLRDVLSWAILRVSAGHHVFTRRERPGQSVGSTRQTEGS